MGFYNSFLFQLFGRKPSFNCRICGKRGGMYLEGRVANKDQFKIVGKKESGHLILECTSCTRRFFFDPITGNEKWNEEGVMGDMLDFMAKEKMKEKQKG